MRKFRDATRRGSKNSSKNVRMILQFGEKKRRRKKWQEQAAKWSEKQKRRRKERKKNSEKVKLFQCEAWEGDKKSIIVVAQVKTSFTREKKKNKSKSEEEKIEWNNLPVFVRDFSFLHSCAVAAPL